MRPVNAEAKERKAMRKMPMATYLWPGLPQLWIHGNWSAVAVAFAAAVGLNLALLGTFAWSELFGPDLRTALWVGLGIAWGVAAAYSVVWRRRRETGALSPAGGDPFANATDEYLKGSYFQAERLLGELLRRDHHDLDARLMLATLMRHSGRFDEARRQLDILLRLEGAEKWELEIRRERELLIQGGSGNPAETEDNPVTNVNETRLPAERTHAA